MSRVAGGKVAASARPAVMPATASRIVAATSASGALRLGDELAREAGEVMLGLMVFPWFWLVWAIRLCVWGTFSVRGECGGGT